jgi:hypothetical protein
VHATVPLLSQNNIVGFYWQKLSSLKSDLSHTILRTQCAHARYSALQDNNSTRACCLELHAIGALAHLTINPETEQ